MLQPTRPRWLRRRNARHGSRLKAPRCRLVSRGSKRSSLSTLPFTLNTRKVSLYCFFQQPIWWTPSSRSASIFCATNPGGYGIAGFQSQTLVKLVITHIQFREKQFLSFIASTRKKFSLTLMRSAFSSHPASIANWQCEKAQMQAVRLWLTGHRQKLDWGGDRAPHHESDAVIYELHVKGFTK